MKTKLYLFFSLTLILLMSSCNNYSTKKNAIGHRGWSYEMAGRDTINLTENGVKQGHWRVYKTAVLHHTIYTQSGSDTAIKKSITSSPERVKMEEGFYKDNKKEGVWKYFSTSGILKDSVVYKNDVAVLK